MAIMLVQTTDHTTLVHTDDPDVRAPGLSGWVRLSDLPPDAVGPAANRVTIRPLAGVEYLSTVSIGDSGQRAIEALRRALVTLDGRAWCPEVEATLLAWPWDILASLHSVVREVSQGPTRRRS